MNIYDSPILVLSQTASKHGRRSPGGGQEDESPIIWSGDTNANCPLRFFHVSKFQAPDCLHFFYTIQ